MSAPGFPAHLPHRYPPLPGKGLSGLSYIRKHFYIPEVIPLVGVVLCSLGMGVYFSQAAARKNDVQWQPRTQPWLRTPTERTHWDGIGGVKEMIQKDLRK
ncbi:unnamed protein product [Rhizoctonia solani]|uniref:Uncharacterized protein n=1 Tax=Rhizoctonia solani TaxID=456999 RepID=A0A8H3C2L4_9AGAM|nr:unnamed protein product [Rhizoctonia solani]